MATGKIENILNKMGALAQEIFCLKCHVEFFGGEEGTVFGFWLLVAYSEM